MGKWSREEQAARDPWGRHRCPDPTCEHYRGGRPHGLGCTCGRGADPGRPPREPSPELVRDALLDAAFGQFFRDETVPAAYARRLAAEPYAGRPGLVDAGAALAIDRLLGRLWREGWHPLDAWQLVRRRADPPAVSLLVDAIAVDTMRYAPATVDRRWTAQVRQLEADVWWDRDQPYLWQWAERTGRSAEATLRCLIGLLAALTVCPQLPRIIPAPGMATDTAEPATGVDQKILARVRGLLAKAESTEFPEEAEALSAKAQELMNRHAFERALLDAETPTEPVAASSRMWLDSPYVDAKWHLVAAVAQANRCRPAFYPKIGLVVLVGEEMDLEITEVLATSLLVQAVQAMVAEGRQITRYGTSRTRSFRRSFLVSYAARIGERLDEAAASARDAAGDARLLPVLAERSRMVDETFQRMFGRKLRGRTTVVSNDAGWAAGRAAADRADLGPRRRLAR